ncbi:MAG: saccharopine dehydrogenase C-terminal domain-containing protein [Bacteroidota bacterium]
MSKKIVVLGAGLVGNAMAIDLSKDHEVTSIDINQEALNPLKEYGVKTIQADLSSPGKIGEIVSEYDLVIGSVPGFMGYRMMEEVINAGKNIVDISFYPEDPFGLDDLAKEKGVVAVMDCGVAPGMGNIILGYHNTQMEIEDYECLVGGLPVVREWPFEYKAVFSPIDVIEEYTRPARYVVNGAVVIREALSDTELVSFPGLGTLESWNSDGLRSLIKTMDIPNMIEKTLRYPGAVEYLRVLRASGFFSEEPVEVNGTLIRPIDLTAKLVFPKWKLKPGEEDYTVMRVKMSGEGKTITYDLLDRFDKETNTISMARTTGYTATAVANLVLEGDYYRIGISPPEYLGESKSNFEYILKYLADRGVIYNYQEE